MTLTINDHQFLLRAIEVGAAARFSAPPNPWVGSVIVRDGVIIGEGYTSAYGGAHAEVNALNSLKVPAEGSTVYVTLEPCSHHGKTAPCADALIAAKVARVVVALEDPDPQVAGRGLQRLRDAGIEVVLGVGHDEAASSLAPYLHHRRTGRPYCILKAAISLDGRLAAADGSSQWITSPESRVEVQRIRAESQAIMIGAETAIRDLPTLNVRYEQFKDRVKQPLRVVLDSQARAPAEGPLFDTAASPTLFFTCVTPPKKWLATGVEVIQVAKGGNGRGVDLSACLDILGQRGVLQLMVEGGGALFGSFLREGFIDHLSLFQGACTLGDQATPLFSGKGPMTISEAARWDLLDVERFGNDLKMDYRLRHV